MGIHPEVMLIEMEKVIREIKKPHYISSLLNCKDYNKIALALILLKENKKRLFYILKEKIYKTDKELSVKLNISPTRVQQLFHKAKKELKNYLKFVEFVGTGETEKLNKEMIELNLSPRTQHCLEIAGIKTFMDLLNKSELSLLALKNLGQKSLEEIKHKLSLLGYKLKEDK